MTLIENSVDIDDEEMVDEVDYEMQSFKKDYRRINKDIKMLQQDEKLPAQRSTKLISKLNTLNTMNL